MESSRDGSNPISESTSGAPTVSAKGGLKMLIRLTKGSSVAVLCGSMAANNGDDIVDQSREKPRKKRKSYAEVEKERRLKKEAERQTTNGQAISRRSRYHNRSHGATVRTNNESDQFPSQPTKESTLNVSDDSSITKKNDMIGHSLPPYNNIIEVPSREVYDNETAGESMLTKSEQDIAVRSIIVGDAEESSSGRGKMVINRKLPEWHQNENRRTSKTNSRQKLNTSLKQRNNKRKVATVVEVVPLLIDPATISLFGQSSPVRYVPQKISEGSTSITDSELYMPVEYDGMLNETWNDKIEMSILASFEGVKNSPLEVINWPNSKLEECFADLVEYSTNDDTPSELGIQGLW